MDSPIVDGPVEHAVLVHTSIHKMELNAFPLVCQLACVKTQEWNEGVAAHFILEYTLRLYTNNSIGDVRGGLNSNYARKYGSNWKLN